MRAGGSPAPTHTLSSQGPRAWKDKWQFSEAGLGGGSLEPLFPKLLD